MSTLDNNRITNCQNCNKALSEGFIYCPECSQKIKHNHWSLLYLFKEFFYNLLNFDSKLVQTFKHIWIPSRLTIMYFEGKRSRYYHPMRLLVISVFGFIGFALIQIDLSLVDKFSNQLKEYTIAKEINSKIDSIASSLNMQDHPIVDSLNSNFQKDYSNNMDSTFSIIRLENLDSISISSIINDTPEKIIEKHNLNTFWQKLWVYQINKFYKDPKGMLVYILSNMTWASLLFITLMALLSKLLFIRTKRYYVEHFVFYSHITVFLTSLSILILLLHWITAINTPLTILVWLGASFIYSLLALKFYYKQSWFKIIFKFFILSFFSLFILIFVLALIAIITFLIF